MSGPFDVFHVDGERGLRGGERQLVYLAAALERRGHRGRVVCRAGSPLQQEARRLGLSTLELPFLAEWDLWSAWRLRREAASCARPLIHAHTAHGAALAALASAAGGPPAVAHRRVDFRLNGALSRRLKYASASRVLAVSSAVREILVGDGLPPESVSVLHDSIPVGPEEASWAGLEPGRLAPPDPELRRCLRAELSSEFGIPEDAPWVGNLAALVPHKDHDTLLACAVVLLLKRPDAVFLVAGEGPEGPRLLDSVKRMGLLGRVFFIGQRPDPLSVLKTLDAFVLSSWGEGMGSVLLEAAACGIPVAATRAGGIPEVVEHERTGLLSPTRDPEALAASLLRLLSWPEEAARLARAAQGRLSEFSLTRAAEKTERIYEEACRR